MPSTEEISAQQELLASNRRTLQIYIDQRTKMGGSLYIPPSIANGMYEAREHIRQIKGFLQGCGIVVEDLPGDEEDAPTIQTEQQLPGPETVSIQIGGKRSKIIGNARDVNIEEG